MGLGKFSSFVLSDQKIYLPDDSRQHCRLGICFSESESETNPNDNLMMRRAGLSLGCWLGWSEFTFFWKLKKARAISGVRHSTDFITIDEIVIR